MHPGPFQTRQAAAYIRRGGPLQGPPSIVSSVSIRECLKGRFLSHFHLGIGVIVDNEGGEVSVQFRDGSTHVYNQKSLSLGKLALIEQSKHLPAQSIESSIEAIKSIKIATRGTTLPKAFKTSDFTVGKNVTHHFRGDGVVHTVEDGKVQIKFKKRGSIHGYSEEKIALGKLAILGSEFQEPSVEHVLQSTKRKSESESQQAQL